MILLPLVFPGQRISSRINRLILLTVGNSGSIWSSDYSEYDEYELESDADPKNPAKSVAGNEEKEIGNDLPPEIYCDLVSML